LGGGINLKVTDPAAFTCLLIRIVRNYA